MAIHELYLGGPSTANASRAMFPAPAFSNSAEPFLSMRAAAHKGPAAFGLNRVLDFASDTALMNWAATNTVAQADALGVLIIPKFSLLLGVHFNVVTASGVAMSLTPRLRTPAALFPVVDGNATGATLTAPGVAAGIAATGSAATIIPWYTAAPAILELILTTWTAFGALRLEINAVLLDLRGSGQY